MKKTSSWILFISFVLVIVFGYVSCKKDNVVLPDNSTENLSKKDKESNELSLRASSSSSSTGNPVYDSIIKKYNLVRLTTVPSGFQGLTITTISQGSAFFDNVAVQTAGRTQTRTISKGRARNGVILALNNSAVTAGLEDDPITHLNIVIDFGNWSNMNISFDFTPNGMGGYNVNNATATVSGFTFGIGYAAQSTTVFNTPGQINFAINGTFSAGIGTSPGVNFGYSTPYYYQVRVTPLATSYAVNTTEGKGTK